tara:strand:+ start:722 stop:1528 length:807 start_codon:yes stop_codon:yes gene_type:complete
MEQEQEQNHPDIATIQPLNSDQPLTVCWCAGKGATGKRISANGNEYFDHFCVCAIGQQMKEDQDTATTVQRKLARGKVIDRLWERVNVPRRFTGMRLQDSPHTDLALRLVFTTGEPYEETQEPESWFLHGAVGVGKTCLAVGYAYEMVQAHLTSARFVTLPAMMSEIRSCYDDGGPSEKEVLRHYKEAELLILDDMGAEHSSGTTWLSDRLYQILGARHDQLRPTIMTSNLSISELSHIYGDRITSRINEMCNNGNNVMHIEGRNLRE